MAKKPVEKVGIAAFSFALRTKGKSKRANSGPCNRSLAYDVGRAVRELKNLRKDYCIGSQVEIASELPKRLKLVCIVSEHVNKDQYLDSKEVARQIAEEFRRNGVAKVIVVAHPFLHLTHCKSLMRGLGFEIYPFKVWSPGFDPDSDQWQTQSAAKCFVYAVGKKLGFG